jgi:hypothetical protein
MRHKLTSGVSSLSQAAAHPRETFDRAMTRSPLPEARDFWGSLREMRVWWPVLIPVLLWAFWRAYQRERASVKVGNGRS